MTKRKLKHNKALFKELHGKTVKDISCYTDTDGLLVSIGIRFSGGLMCQIEPFGADNRIFSCTKVGGKLRSVPRYAIEGAERLLAGTGRLVKKT